MTFILVIIIFVFHSFSLFLSYFLYLFVKRKRRIFFIIINSTLKKATPIVQAAKLRSVAENFTVGKMHILNHYFKSFAINQVSSVTRIEREKDREREYSVYSNNKHFLNR